MKTEERLFTILVCPISGERLRLLEEGELESVNTEIRGGRARRRDGEPADQTIHEGLLAPRAGFLYPVRDDLPFLLPEDAIVTA